MASAKAWVEGDSPLSLKWGAGGEHVMLESGRPSQDMQLMYSPVKTGAHAGRLVVEANWEDGHREQQAVPVRAAARSEHEVPGTGVAANSPKAPARAEDDSWRSAPAPTTMGERHSEEAFQRAVAKTFRFQRDGVQVISDEQSKYSPPEAPTPLWLDLAEVAISLGTAGITSMLGKLLANRIATSIGAGANAVAEKIDQTTKVAPDPGSRVNDVVDALLDGMKGAAESAGLKRITPEASDGEPQHTNGNSQDAAIDFFSGQDALLTDAESKARSQATIAYARFTQLEPAAPGITTRVASLLDGASSEVSARAKAEQMRHTTAKWLAYRTRVSLGTETAPTAGGSVTVGKLDKARAFDKLLAPSVTTGLLDIRVDLVGSRPHVRGAAIRGVSRLLADRLLTMDLRAAHVPVRIVIGDDLGFITRDEAGRVRYSGLVHLDRDTTAGAPIEERQELRTAQAIADAVLGRTLAKWGVAAIEHDDSTKKGS